MNDNEISSFTIFTGATVINHDSEERRLANSKSGSPEKGSFQRIVTYKATMEQIKTVMDLSFDCRQFIKWECLGAIITSAL